MKNPKVFLALFFALTCTVLLGQGCTEASVGSALSEQQQVQDIHEKQAVAVPLPVLDNSLERINIKKRLELFDNPNKVSYIYLINYGKVMAFYVIKGKVTSGNKRLTSSQKVDSSHIDCGQYSCDHLDVLEAPELDGTYGSSAPYIFFFTTDGAYIQWSGDYMLSDFPLKLTTQPELVREIK